MLSTLTAGAVSLWVCPASAEACATCFGASDSKLAQGMNMGILTLLVFVALVLSGLAAFFIHLAVRASRVSSRSTGPGPGAVAGGIRSS